jgi:hypothetical protein
MYNKHIKSDSINLLSFLQIAALGLDKVVAVLLKEKAAKQHQLTRR